MSEYLYAELARRPVSLMRCPQGVSATSGAAVMQCFFQKHLEHLPRGMTPVRSPNPKIADYVAVEGREAIVALAQHGTIEFHTWGARMPKLAQPDRMIFDLDPDPDLGWSRLIEAAFLTRTLLQQLGMPTLLKTTGGKGLHVVVPVKPTRSWEEIKSFARSIAQRLASVAPDRFTATLTKARRTGKVFVDYLRNGEGATYIAAYSLRAREGAPVAMPIDWDELTPKLDLRGAYFNIGNAAARAPESAALWRDADTQRASVTLQMMRRVSALGGK
jgi:bifunctional non-homologous end joining protein LigD